MLDLLLLDLWPTHVSSGSPISSPFSTHLCAVVATDNSNITRATQVPGQGLGAGLVLVCEGFRIANTTNTAASATTTSSSSSVGPDGGCAYDCVVLDDRRCFPLSMTTMLAESASRHQYQGVMMLAVPPFIDHAASSSTSVTGQGSKNNSSDDVSSLPSAGVVPGLGEGAGLLAFLSLYDGALYASVVLQATHHHDYGSANHTTSAPSSSCAMPQLLPCSLVVGMGDGQGGPYVLAVAVADANEGGGGGVWLATHSHRRGRNVRGRGGRGRGRGERSSCAVVFLPVCPAACVTGGVDRPCSGQQWSRDLSAGALVRRALGLTHNIDTSRHYNNHNHVGGDHRINSSGAGEGSSNHGALGFAMQEVMLQMQTLASQQTGTTQAHTLTLSPSMVD